MGLLLGSELLSKGYRTIISSSTNHPQLSRRLLFRASTEKTAASTMTSTSTSPASSDKNRITSWPKLTLYGDLNMRPFRNIWMLEEIGLDYHHMNCKPWSRRAKSVHPLGKVPALLVESSQCNDIQQQFVVLESGAINTFLGDLAREVESSNQTYDAKTSHIIPMLVPPPATTSRARYDSLVLFIMTELDSQALWIHRKHSDMKEFFGEAPTAVAEAKRQFDNALDAIEHELHENGYLLPSFSAADIAFFQCCSWAQQIGWLARSSDESIAISAGVQMQTQQHQSKSHSRQS